jgi:hypothetical protein
MATISPNIASITSSAWTLTSATITNGIADPAGTTLAGRVTGTSGQGNAAFYILDNTPITAGDVYVYGAWMRSQTANGWSQNSVPLLFGFGHSGFGNGDTCTPNSGVLWFPPSSWQDGQWAWMSGFCKVYTNPTNAGIALIGLVDTTHTIEYFGPVLMKFTSGTKSDNEIYEIANSLNSFSPSCTQGQICTLTGPLTVP